MEPGRTTREQRGGMRDDNTGTGGQWDDPMSKSGQGKWEQRGGELELFAQSRLGPPLRGLSLISGSLVTVYLGSR